MTKSILFGGAKGFGESILINYQDDRYCIIDSYISQKSGDPIVLEYLTDNAIKFNQVDFVILTHFHQDHYSGISKILTVCKNAKFFCSDLISLPSFQFLVAASKQTKSKFNFFNELNNIFDVLKSTNRSINTLTDKSNPVFKSNFVKIYSLSPNLETNFHFDPIYKERAKRVVDKKGVGVQLGSGFNFQSVVIVVEFKELSILYGADLEYHSSNKRIGWDSVINDLRFKKLKFDIFKIPHHGSKNGYNKLDWKGMLKKNAILKMTPYSRGAKLPEQDMILKILNISNQSYITSEIRYKKLPNQIRKQIEGLDIKRIAGDEGIIEIEGDGIGLETILYGGAKKLI